LKKEGRGRKGGKNTFSKQVEQTIPWQ